MTTALTCLAVAVVALLVVLRERRLARRGIAAVELQRRDAAAAFAERDSLSTRLEHLALHDMLTGLPNRTMFQQQLQAALAGLDTDECIGVLFIDLDDFKIVNDSLGHAAGDELLTAVGSRLAHAVRADDVVARFGGDEFAVLLRVPETREAARGVARRLLGVLRAPFVLAAGMASGQGSGGLVIGCRDDSSVEEQASELMRCADLAMYSAKAAGGGECLDYQDEMLDGMLERLALQDDMTSSLIHGDFRVLYQPVVDLDSGMLTCVEALARWDHPERGEIQPSTFIPLAEASGAIVTLGLWVLENACADLQRWDEQFPGSELRLAVNLSARQLRESSVAPQIARVLHRTAIDPRRLVLEVTESLLMDDTGAAAATLWQLRALGIRIAVDDFGTGYSSLGRLVDLPLDDLKIDRTFVAELTRSSAGATIITAAVAMAHGLGLRVTAEGVEDDDQLAFLSAIGCDSAQGYVFSRPVPPESIAEVLAAGSRLAEPKPDRAARLLEAAGSLPPRPSALVLPAAARHR